MVTGQNGQQGQRQTVLFVDLDGTIIRGPFGKVVFPAVLGRLAELTGARYETLMQHITALNLRRQHTPNPPDAAWVMDWDDMIQEVAREHGVPAGQIAPDACERLVIEQGGPPNSAALDEAQEVLQRLRAPGHRRLVVSTMGLSKYQLPVLRALNLLDYFDDVLAPDLMGCQKFERAFFSRYLDQQPGASAGHTRFISVGDNYLHDVAFPKSLGFYAVLRLPEPELNALPPFERPRHLEPYAQQIQYFPVRRRTETEAEIVWPDAVVTHLAELPEVVAQLEAQDTRQA